MSLVDIRRKFGAKGIVDYAPAFGRRGAITDDTQMTLFTGEGLIRGWVRGCFKGITSYPSVTAHAYLRWLKTQGERSRCDTFGEDEPGWLMGHADLHHRRAPGNTCLAALREMRALGDRARNDSKGCGGVMRAAPVGLFAWSGGKRDEPQFAFDLGVELAALTHGHPTGSLAAGAFSVLILALVDGASLDDALRTAKACLRLHALHEETVRALEMAEELASGSVGSDDAIAQLGQGWVAEEALAIAVYCALVSTKFRDGVILSVNHGGDSDSTGAIAGSLLGAMQGVGRIPGRCLQALELRDVITDVATDLFEFVSWDIGEGADDEEINAKVWRKYPGF